MKAIVINQYGGKEELKETTVNKPSINENQVLVEIHATSVNPIDWKMREGYLKEMFPFEFPITLGWDAAGIITEKGSKVKGFQKGDRVFTRPATTRHGTYAEYVAVEEERLAKMPDEMSFEEGAAIPLAGLTALQCIQDLGEVQEGQRVLIHAGAGGVGNFAIQIAKHIGAYVVTTASGKNEDLVTSLGADQLINYKEEDFSEAVENIDFVLDAVGGDVQSKSYKVLKENGKLVSIVEPPSEEEARKYGVNASFHWLKENGKQLQQLADLYKTGEVRPVINKVFPFHEHGLQEAHSLSESHHASGKIVIQIKE
ncbi:NADP-dependent oxidoreductase [Thalassorhabdus alkalitolerans]|uniref:NADP-dependent oxidoreductase n=1 Tax=Thalassorhabdus alkalitolerans TaxID=2282697 RepID=A0ABW0YPA6_9BACI